MQKGRASVLNFALMLMAVFGLYLIIAWGSYSPLDNGWTISSSATKSVLNKSGALGAISIDILLAMFGNIAVLVPFTLAFTPTYLLLLKRTEQLNRWQIFQWGAGFMLFMVGLCGLFAILFSPTPYYLSGGFLGGIFTALLLPTLGQIGGLLVAMLLISVGFYFCSARILIQLFNRLYQWIFALKPVVSEKQTVKNPQELQENVSLTPLVTPDFVKQSYMTELELQDINAVTDENITLSETLPDGELNEQPLMSSNLTDISHFTRPNPTIYGLYKSQIEHDIPAELTQTVLEHELPNAVVMPTVRLNSEMTLKNHELHIQQTLEENTENNSVPMPSSSIKPFVEQVMEPISEKIEPELSMPTVSIPVQSTGHENVNTEQSAPTVYPKGYGEHLIHPLLKQKTVQEKPVTPFPTLNLLTQEHSNIPPISEQEIWETSARIEQELANFGVKATVEDVLIGPVVTRYEIKPAAGVKASKITSLDSDLARALIFKAIRITDVVPGKPYMGIETPNKYRETVWMRDVLASEAFRQSNAILPMALGKDISGEPVVVDMAKMPHLLVAGQTGGGKSVGINTMILSLLYKLSPEDVRFIMIDPKVVELSIYNDIPHLLTPVVTDMKKAENALRWAVEEMERRYLLVSSLSVRNIEGYNEKIRQAEEMGFPIPNTLWRPGDTMDSMPPPLEKMSYIVLIVDEFADLIMSVGKQVEDHIMRIAQKARAVGIHLILATQRPSTDVITGVIKANIPSRIAFTVASQVDSRTILDKSGAENLLGRGDMLYSGAGSPDIIRVHGAFMTDDDVQRVADNWRARGKPSYIESIVEPPVGEGNLSHDEPSSIRDEKFDEVAQYVIETGITSITGIQRRFSLGFSRAARIRDQLEAEGILPAQDKRGR